MKIYFILLFIVTIILSCSDCPTNNNDDQNLQEDVLFENFLPFMDASDRIRFYPTDYIFEDSIKFNPDQIPNIYWKTPYEINSTLYTKIVLKYDLDIISLYDSVDTYVVLKFGFGNGDYFAQDIINFSEGTINQQTISKEIDDYMFISENISFSFLFDSQGQGFNLNLMSIKVTNLEIKGYHKNNSN